MNLSVTNINKQLSSAAKLTKRATKTGLNLTYQAGYSNKLIERLKGNRRHAAAKPQRGENISGK